MPPAGRIDKNILREIMMAISSFRKGQYRLSSYEPTIGFYCGSKNRLSVTGGISARIFRDLLRILALDITPDWAAALTGLIYKTAGFLPAPVRSTAGACPLVRAECLKSNAK